jgi:ADP-heptose:LPS heptosyltransferase
MSASPARPPPETRVDGPPARILVIKLGALGDFVQALGPAKAIRRHHAGAHIVLLTTAPFAALARASGAFDEVWLDARPALYDLPGWLLLRRRLKAGRFDRVYDLQTSLRSSWYFRLLGPGPRPEWSGIARGASHFHANAARDRMHTLERQADQLRLAGISDVPPLDIGSAHAGWTDAALGRFALPAAFALLAPGGAAHRPRKRWPVERYAALGRALAERGLTPVVLGSAGEHPLGAAIAEAAPGTLNLAGATSLEELASLARRAALAVGNDTGPMHLIAAAGCPSLVLFSAASDPALCAPRGNEVHILRRPRLEDLTLEEVLAALPAPARLHPAEAEK